MSACRHSFTDKCKNREIERGLLAMFAFLKNFVRNSVRRELHCRVLLAPPPHSIIHCIGAVLGAAVVTDSLPRWMPLNIHRGEAPVRSCGLQDGCWVLPLGMQILHRWVTDIVQALPHLCLSHGVPCSGSDPRGPSSCVPPSVLRQGAELPASLSSRLRRKIRWWYKYGGVRDGQ